MATKKERLDVLLVKLGFSESREQAKRLIMAGQVFVGGQREDKPGTSFAEEGIRIEVRGGMKYVSRGGYKLEKALATFPIILDGKTCMDIGASVKYLPSASNPYHSEIHGNDTNPLLSKQQRLFLAGKAVIIA